MADAAITARLDDHFVAFLSVAHPSADRRHNARRFMARHEREFDIAPNPFDRLEIRGAKSARANPHQHLAYADAGHAGFGAPVAPDNPNLRHLADFGGTVAGNQAARSDGWPKALAFLATAFRNGCR